MKIVFLAPFGIRPKGTVIARMLPLAAELQRIGHTVIIVAPPYTNPEDSGKTEVINGVVIRNIELGPENRFVSAVALSWRLYRAVRDEMPDLVHLFKPKGYGGMTALLMILLRSFGLRQPYLFVDTDDWEGKGGMNTLHDYSGLEKLVFSLQEDWLLKWSVAVTVASRGLESQARDLGISPDKILYLPNCVNPASRGDGAKIRKRFGINADDPVILLYTRFFEFEQERLHRIFAEIREKVPAVRFLVVGKGRHGEEDELVRACQAAGFEDSLVVAGWVEPHELPDYLAAGDVAIYPFDDNLVNRCKCPAKLTELLMANVAVVGDRVGQIPEYIQDNVSGLLCESGDSISMANSAAELLGNRDKRIMIGNAGRQRLIDKFNWYETAVKLNKFYLEHSNK